MHRGWLSTLFGSAIFVLSFASVTYAEVMCAQVMIDCDEVECDITATEDVCALRAIAQFYKSKAEESTELSVLCAGIVASVEQYNPRCLKDSFDKEGGKKGPKVKKDKPVKIFKNEGNDFSATR